MTDVLFQFGFISGLVCFFFDFEDRDWKVLGLAVKRLLQNTSCIAMFFEPYSPITV